MCVFHILVYIYNILHVFTGYKIYRYNFDHLVSSFIS